MMTPMEGDLDDALAAEIPYSTLHEVGNQSTASARAHVRVRVNEIFRTLRFKIPMDLSGGLHQHALQRIQRR